jgi:hypothetical protein
MLQIILMLGLTGTQAANQKLAQIHTCQWPNKCEQSVQVQPCNWPNKCAMDKVVALSDGPITTCDFPKKCASIN